MLNSIRMCVCGKKPSLTFKKDMNVIKITKCPEEVSRHEEEEEETSFYKIAEQ